MQFASHRGQTISKLNKSQPRHQPKLVTNLELGVQLGVLVTDIVSIVTSFSGFELPECLLSILIHTDRTKIFFF